MSPSQPRGDGGRSVRRCDDRNDLEFDQVLPAGGPLPKERSVLALHNLEAAPEVLRDPTRHVSKALRHESALVAKAPVHRERVAVPKVLDDHVLHPGISITV